MSQYLQWLGELHPEQQARYQQQQQQVSDTPFSRLLLQGFVVSLGAQKRWPANAIHVDRRHILHYFLLCKGSNFIAGQSSLRCASIRLPGNLMSKV